MAETYAGTQNYDEKFYRLQKEGSYKSASIILPLVQKFIQPQSVIDIGCGVGTWLAAWKNLGVVEIHGVDGDYVDRAQLFIPQENFHPYNLENRITINKKFDLVETLEVAEHLSPARADSFVEDLTNLGNVILFSAAIAWQGGTNHVNEQMQSYWAEKFLCYGYVPIDCIRPQIWNINNGKLDAIVATCYIQNIMIYVKTTELYRYPALQEYYLKHKENQILDVVHHELWGNRMIQVKNVLTKVQMQFTNGGGQ